MQRVIESEFQGHTVVSVLHRLNYIDRFHRVLVLKEGKVVECDTPETLLSGDSALNALYLAHSSQ